MQKRFNEFGNDDDGEEGIDGRLIIEEEEEEDEEGLTTRRVDGRPIMGE